MAEDRNGNARAIFAFPRGEERQRINTAFDELISALKEDGFLHERGEVETPEDIQYQARKNTEEQSDDRRGVSDISNFQQGLAGGEHGTQAIDGDNRGNGSRSAGGKAFKSLKKSEQKEIINAVRNHVYAEENDNFDEARAIIALFLNKRPQDMTMLDWDSAYKILAENLYDTIQYYDAPVAEARFSYLSNNVSDLIQKIKPDAYEHIQYQSGIFSGDEDEDVQWSIRKEAPPKTTKTGYKVFTVKDGKLYPPMVANPDAADTPVGVWLNADVGQRAPDSKTGRMQVKAGGKGTQGGSGSLAFRPGWHLGEVPVAKQFDRLNPETGVKELFPSNFVWAECEIAADVNYQEEAMSYGYTESGKFQHSLAGLPRVPENGYYQYRTNPRPDTVPWLITGAMKVKRVLSDADVAEILRSKGLDVPKRQGGEKTLADLGLEQYEGKQYQSRPTSVSDEAILERAAYSVSELELSDGEKDALRIFKERLSALRELQQKRYEAGQLYKEQQFSPNPDREAAQQTLNRMKILDDQIARAEKLGARRKSRRAPLFYACISTAKS